MSTAALPGCLVLNTLHNNWHPSDCDQILVKGFFLLFCSRRVSEIASVQLRREHTACTHLCITFTSIEFLKPTNDQSVEGWKCVCCCNKKKIPVSVKRVTLPWQEVNFTRMFTLIAGQSFSGSQVNRLVEFVQKCVRRSLALECLCSWVNL